MPLLLESPKTPPWNFKLPLPAAAELPIKTIRSAPEPITLPCLGPLTNIAAKVREVVALGGSFTDSPQPEFNARCDPEAADIVLKSDWPVSWLGRCD